MQTFVMFADLHLDRRFAWASPASAKRRRHAIRATLQNVLSLADRVDADAVLCGGDLYENELFTPDTAAFVASAFDCGRPVLISPGNHDFYSASSMYARTAWSPNVTVFRESVLRPQTLGDGLTVWGAAHLAPSGTPGFLDSFAGVDRGGANLALFHGSERGGLAIEGDGKVGHAPFDAKQIPGAGFDYAFVGHHHGAVAGPHHCYPGNPDPLEFGESTGRGAVVARVSDSGEVQISHHRVSNTQCHSIDVDVSGAVSVFDIVEAVRGAVAELGGFVRIDLCGTLGADIGLAASDVAAAMPTNSIDHLDELVIRQAGLTQAYDLDSVLAEDLSVRARFVELALADPERSAQDRDLIIELGLRAFDGRSDLEVI